MSLVALSRYLVRVEQAYLSAGTQLALDYTVCGDGLKLSAVVHATGCRAMEWYYCAVSGFVTVDLQREAQREVSELLGRRATFAISELSHAYAGLVRRAKRCKRRRVTLIYR